VLRQIVSGKPSGASFARSAPESRSSSRPGLLPKTRAASTGSAAMLPLSPPASIGRQSNCEMPAWPLRLGIAIAPESCCAP